MSMRDFQSMTVSSLSLVLPFELPASVIPTLSLVLLDLVDMVNVVYFGWVCLNTKDEVAKPRATLLLQPLRGVYPGLPLLNCRCKAMYDTGSCFVANESE
eukprot:scaffold311246_cov96-Cyclotella_meneghiniana.AAC.5